MQKKLFSWKLKDIAKNAYIRGIEDERNARLKLRENDKKGVASVSIRGDDGGFLEVYRYPDNDMHLSIAPNEHSHTHAIRFRTYFGGGTSENVRLALRQLMIAIENDPKSIK
jgi:hypothetical protein